MPASDSPSSPEPPGEPVDLRQSGPPIEQNEQNQDDEVSALLNDLAAEIASLRAETRSEIGHLGRLIRAEGIRLSRQFSSEIADLVSTITTDDRQHRTTLTRLHLAIAQLVGAAIIITFVRLMM